MKLSSILRFLRAPRSLTRKLFVRMTLVMCLGVVLIAIVSETAVAAIVNRNFDQQLVLGANLLINLMYEELQDIKNHQSNQNFEVDDTPLLSYEDRKAFDDYANWRMFRIWYHGKLRLGSDTGPALTEPAYAQTSKFTDVIYAGDKWRIYNLSAPSGDPIVQVGERLQVRRELVHTIALELTLPFIVIALLLLLVIWVCIRTGLRDLEGFSKALSRQNDRPPFRPVLAQEWPLELSQLTQVINGLFSRIEDGLNHERKFIDMAAHQLRTPLSGLSIEAQLCARTKDPEELSDRLLKLNKATRRVSNLVDQLLTLAQIGAIEGQALKPLSVTKILGQIIADLAPVAAKRAIELAIEGDDFELWGQEMAFHLLLTNILENAVKYTSDASEVLIHLSADSATNQARIDISDHGAGMTYDEKQQAFERFWQASKGKSPGSGLGLAIAAESAQVLKGHLSLHDRSDGLGGLVVSFEVALTQIS